MGPYILLGVVVAMLLAVGLWELITTIRGRKKWLWPAGERVTGTYGEYTVHFICSDMEPPMPLPELAKRAALAAHCLQLVNEAGRPLPYEIAVHLLGDEAYTKKYDSRFGTKSNGMLQTVFREAGGEEMPLVVCRAGTFVTTPLTGSLVIHELLHYVYPHDRPHGNKLIWGNGLDSVEGKAQSFFVDLLEVVKNRA